MRANHLVIAVTAGCLLLGCKKPPTVETIQAKDHDLLIERDGKALVSVRPYMNGTEVTIKHADGDWVTVHTSSPSGAFSSVTIQRSMPDGSPILVEVLPDGTAINRSKFPIGTWPGDDGYVKIKEEAQVQERSATE
jgi:hypothetical protein